jgi:hypothetical protein
MTAINPLHLIIARVEVLATPGNEALTVCVAAVAGTDDHCVFVDGGYTSGGAECFTCRSLDVAMAFAAREAAIAMADCGA